MSSLLLNPVTRAAFSGVAPSAATFEIVANQIARLDPAAVAPAAYTVEAPAFPWEGAAFAVLDVTGAAPLHPVTVNGNGHNIDGAASVVLDTQRALGVFVFDGSEWRRCGAPPFELQAAGDAVLAFNRFDPTPPATLEKIAESTTAGEAYADAVAAAAQAAAVATASADATTKANAAEAAAVATASADATTKANAAQAAAIATASADATTKANAAQAAATTADRVQIAGIAQAVGTALTAGNFTTATRFFVDRSGITLTGVRFWWPGGATRTIKVSFWDAGGTRQASTTVAVNAAGFYVATFSAAQTLTLGTIYRVSLWDNSGVSYLKTTSAAANALVPARAFHAGAGLYYESITYYGAGDVFPNSSGSEAYLMDPQVTP